MLTRTFYSQEIEAAALAHGLPARLVEAVVIQESSGDTDAFRYEPAFWRRYLSKLERFKGSNPRRVSSSYGLMQVMFTTAQEAGYSGNPEGLFVPEVGLDVGCRHLRALIAWAMGDGYSAAHPSRRLRAALASYNGGRGGNAPIDSLGKQPPLRNNDYANAIVKLYGADTL